MIKYFKQIPQPLQKQVLIRAGFVCIFTLLFILFLFMGNDIYTVIPCIALACFFIVNAFLLFRRAILGEYVVINGLCCEVQLTPVRRRTKTIWLETGEHKVQVMIKQRLRRIPVGTALDVYVAKNTPVYDKNGEKLLHTYLAMDIKGGENNA